ncbi:heterokaryon incompatibility protein-domain-containing protein [Paraphoma chrysanthemicola]|uniref:Heterokaryon incompatibility protein-domain-containing protein n=1 Tax=Paraphoma chrysanthemicola TaxID=798071 RepID=A0A8K0R6Z9_9PLEO|nr:heterokaryon incompatibility protein-domain-containing protein [Paraphoma chrysanthemicola]
MTSHLSEKAREVARRTADTLKRTGKLWKHNTYQYSPLPPGNYIRTLVLKPGAGDEPLQCELNIEEMSQAKYEAISYVWGSNKKKKRIICDGQVIAITTNLWTVLRHIRLDAPRVLWADSICINQDDEQEKGDQVTLMGRIFRAAERVLIFIGADDMGHGEQVSSLFKDMNEMIESGLEQAGRTQDAFPYPDEDAPIFRDSRWKSYEYLLEQEWFKRGWVVQEAAVAQLCRILWGRYELAWEHLMKTDLWSYKRGYKIYNSFSVSLYAHIDLYHCYHKDIAHVFFPSGRTYNLIEVLSEAKELEFSDERDRVFSFAELAQDIEPKMAIRPNYKSSLERVYQDFAIDYLRSAKNYKLLDEIYHNEDSLRAEVPSWVPRWDVRGYSMAPRHIWGFPELKPHAVHFKEPEVIENSILRAQGVVLDTIMYRSEPFQKGNTTLGTILSLWKKLDHVQIRSPYPTANLVEAFLHSLSCGQYGGEWSKWQPSRVAVALYLQTQASDQNDTVRHENESGDQEMESFLVFAESKMWNKRFILSERGYMGLAPHVARVGDTCAIIFGCTTPCILRKAESEEQYQFLGAASIMGKQPLEAEGGGFFFDQLGLEESKDWVEWDVKEQDINLC